MENFDDSTCIRQTSSDFSTVKVLRYTVNIAPLRKYDSTHPNMASLMIDNSVHTIPVGISEKAKPVKSGSHNLYNHLNLTVNAENFQAISD